MVKDWGRNCENCEGNKGQLRGHSQSREQVEKTFGRKFATKMF